MIAASSDFDWGDDETIVLREQPATAVYANTRGMIVIRQERPWDEDEDTIVLIDPRHARLVALSLLAVAGLSAASLPPEHSETERQRPKDGTAAERQRRYRDRHNGHGGRDVTAETVTHNASTTETPQTEASLFGQEA